MSSENTALVPWLSKGQKISKAFLSSILHKNERKRSVMLPKGSEMDHQKNKGILLFYSIIWKN